jgi:hypothetical protein
MLMASQTLTAVAVPAGTAPGGRLRVNVYLSPRLSGATTLSEFPDWLAWPELVKNRGLSVTLRGSGGAASIAVTTTPLRPDIWQAIFTPHTTVAPYPRPDYSQRLLVSYPASKVHDFLKQTYQAAAQAAQVGRYREGELLQELLGSLMFRDGTESLLDNVLSELRVTMWQDQQNPDTDTGPPSADLSTHDVAERFALYHRLPPAPNRPPLPRTAADFARLIDFHKALGALAAHPPLLTALGLVFPVELPDGVCPPSPAAGSYLSLAVTAVTPGWQWSNPPDLGQVDTAYARSGTSFAAAPATDPASLANGTISAGDVIDGFLALDPAWFTLAEVDLDGAMLKAMALADSVAFASSSTAIEQVLPSLRSSGISLLATGRAMQLLQAIKDNESFEAALQGGAAPRALNARDLLRGYRLDIWSARVGGWLSLHRRNGTYRFGSEGTVSLTVTDEEGFTQLAVMQPAEDPTRPDDPAAAAAGAPQPGTDLYVHERVARWNGWSLSAPRPGQPLNRSPDPALAADPDPQDGATVTPFKMATVFAAYPGSLPPLRFGDRYRLHVRAVDVAGHSVEPDAQAGDQFALPEPGTTTPYLRYEPVNPPVLVELVLPGPGGSNAQLVIRSRNSHPALDAAASAETDERHVAPPRASVLLTEQHGMLDDSTGRLGADAAVYDLIVSRDRGQFAQVGNRPLEPGEQLAVPYFPDPLARGAAFAGLPHAGPVTQVSFGTGWPDRQPFRIRLADGTAAPSWDGQARVLTVSLAKAESATIPLGCYVDPADMELLGVWDWVREFYEEEQTAVLGAGGAGAALVSLADELALLTQLTLGGGNEMITPRLSMSLVHAVQQPLGRPAWTRLPVVHHPEAPVAIPSPENKFWAVTAWRYVGSHTVVLLGALKVNGASTATVDIEATWTEWLDDTSQPGPTRRAAAGAVDKIQLGSLEAGAVYGDGSQQRMVAIYIPEVDTLWFAAPFDQLPGVTAPTTDVAAPVHNLGDTKHRCVSYRAVASSRFQEYFGEPGLDYTRTSDPLMIDVPSSARPLTPDVQYVVPTFGWERQESTNLKTEVRFGNGLRVYLGRPWYSSGEGELLGVVLWPDSAPSPTDDQREACKEFITQWGLDPLWSTGSIGPVPAIADLTAQVASATLLTIDEADQQVDVAGHTVGYDADRRLWYSDIEFANPGAYMPFVRLALARYQPSSIAGVELSHVVLADFAQLAPDRSASLTLDPATPTQARLVVGGLAPQGPATSVIDVAVEARVPGIVSDLGWASAPNTAVTVTEDAPAPSQPASVLWSGTIAFAAQPAPRQFRVVVREFEVIESAPPGTSVNRLVYAAILPFNFAPTAKGITR